MAFNIRREGDTADVPVHESVKSGDFVRVGHLTGVAEIDAREQRDGQFWTTVRKVGVAHGVVEDVANDYTDVGKLVYIVGDSTTSGGTTLTVTPATGAKIIGIIESPALSSGGPTFFGVFPNAIAEEA